MVERKRRRIRKKLVTNHMRTKMLVFFLLVVVAFFALVGRIWYINKNDGDRYRKKVLSQQTYVSNAISYKRGDITDRNGTVLATSVKLYNLVIAPKTILSEDGKFVDATLRSLCEQFNELSEQELRSILEEKPESQYVVLLKEIDYQKKKDFEDMAKENDFVKGYWFEAEYKRTYPYNSLACNIIGFANKGNTADAGIEGYYNDEMNGVDGREYGYFDSNLDLQQTVKNAVNGNTIVSTIDANIQQIVEDRIKQFNKEFGSKNIGVIVMNPQNGEIYAMSTGYFYDLNDPRNPDVLKQYYTDREISEMTEKEKTDALNMIWRNYCISDAFEPGSTFKTMTVAAALEENKVDDSSTFVCDGGEEPGGTHIACMSRHGQISLRQSLMYSCNDALMQMGSRLERKLFYKYQNIFNFGSRTGIDLPGEATANTFTEEQLNVQELATSSFGQGITVTMIQIAAATCSVINGGYYYQPHVVKEIVNENGAVVKEFTPTLVRRTVSEKTSRLICDYLHDTVESGTGNLCKIEGYSIGGKTGTAEKHPRGNDKYVVSFIGFAPTENPEVLVYVVVDEPNAEEQDHSYYATNVCHDIMEKILPFLKYEPEKKTDDEKDEPDSSANPAESDVPSGEEGQGGNTVPSGEENPAGGENPENSAEPSGEGNNPDDDTGNGSPGEAGPSQEPFDPANPGREGGFFTEPEDGAGDDGSEPPEET